MRKTMKRYAATRGARGVIKQARSDLKRGLQDTERRAAPARRSSSKKK
jgi:hypothetical protein